MEKALFLLMMALLIAVAGIPLAFWVGTQAAQDRISPELRAEILRVHEEDRDTIATLQRQLAELATEEPAPAATPESFEEPVKPQPEPPPEADRALETDPASVDTVADAVDSDTPDEPIVVAQASEAGERSDEADRETREGCGPPIPESAFHAAETGMSYEAVVDRFGREGAIKLTLEDVGGSIVEQYVWEWEKPDGTFGLVRVSFENGKLSGKNYAG